MHANNRIINNHEFCRAFNATFGQSSVAFLSNRLNIEWPKPICCCDQIFDIQRLQGFFPIPKRFVIYKSLNLFVRVTFAYKLLFSSSLYHQAEHCLINRFSFLLLAPESFKSKNDFYFLVKEKSKRYSNF